MYLATGLRALGLDTLAGGPDYRLPVHLVAFIPDPQRTHALHIRSGDSVRTIHPPLFYHPGGNTASFRSFAGDLVVAGPTPGAIAALDAVPNLDITGRVVAVGPPWAEIETVEEELARRGAAGVIEAVPTPFYHRLRVARGPVRFALDRQADTPPDLPRIVIGPEAIDALGMAGVFRPGGIPESGAGRSDAGARPPARSLQTHVTVDLTFRSERRTGYNVAGLLRGSDPDLAHEVVVVLAHYDHVTDGEPENGDSIWNGFADNATGTATALELARLLAADPPARSVLFLFTTAEEQGLLGATAFAENPPVPIDRIRAAVNLDGAAPPADVSTWNLAAPEDSHVRQQASAALAANGDAVELRPIISDSDHWAFHRKGVPALFLFPGALVDGIQPHSPHDEWRPDFPFAGLARYVDAARRVVRALAEPPARP